MATPLRVLDTNILVRRTRPAVFEAGMGATGVVNRTNDITSGCGKSFWQSTKAVLSAVGEVSVGSSSSSQAARNFCHTPSMLTLNKPKDSYLVVCRYGTLCFDVGSSSHLIFN